MFNGMNQQFAALLAPWVRPAAQIAAVSFVLFVTLQAFTGRRRFHRRNAAGVQQFDSYGAAVGVGLMESLLDFVSRVFAAIFAISICVAVLGVVFSRM